MIYWIVQEVPPWRRGILRSKQLGAQCPGVDLPAKGITTTYRWKGGAFTWMKSIHYFGLVWPSHVQILWLCLYSYIFWSTSMCRQCWCRRRRFFLLCFFLRSLWGWHPNRRRCGAFRSRPCPWRGPLCTLIGKISRKTEIRWDYLQDLNIWIRKFALRGFYFDKPHVNGSTPDRFDHAHVRGGTPRMKSREYTSYKMFWNRISLNMFLFFDQIAVLNRTHAESWACKKFQGNCHGVRRLCC